MIVAVVVLAVFASVTSGLAGGFAMLWLHERQQRDMRDTVDLLDASSTRLSAAYIRDELSRLYLMADKPKE
jgi:hypothetical protein